MRDLIYSLLAAGIWMVLFYNFVRAVQVVAASQRRRTFFTQLAHCFREAGHDIAVAIAALPKPSSVKALEWELRSLVEAAVTRHHGGSRLPSGWDPRPTLYNMLIGVGIRGATAPSDWRNLYYARLDAGGNRVHSIATNAKEFGLLGTLLGISKCFGELNSGFQPELLGSIALALSTTAVGVLIAWAVRLAAASHSASHDLAIVCAENASVQLCDLMQLQRAKWDEETQTSLVPVAAVETAEPPPPIRPEPYRPAQDIPRQISGAASLHPKTVDASLAEPTEEAVPHA